MLRRNSDLKLVVFNDRGQLPDDPAVKAILKLTGRVERVSGSIQGARKRVNASATELLFVDPEELLQPIGDRKLRLWHLMNRAGDFGAAYRFALNGGSLPGVIEENGRFAAGESLAAGLVRSELRYLVVRPRRKFRCNFRLPPYNVSLKIEGCLSLKN